MKLTELITYAQALLDEFGDHEISKTNCSDTKQCKPVKVSLTLDKDVFIKRKTVTEHEEITIKRREPVYRISITDDIIKGKE